MTEMALLIGKMLALSGMGMQYLCIVKWNSRTWHEKNVWESNAMATDLACGLFFWRIAILPDHVHNVLLPQPMTKAIESMKKID